MLATLNLEFNPFEPTATGPPIHGHLLDLGDTHARIRDFLNRHDQPAGTKALIVKGEYGSGKTCVLRWLHEHELPARGFKSFYFRDPGVHFYRLADSLLRTIGRKDFAKFVWELAHSYVESPYQGNLFRRGFEEFVRTANTRSQRDILTNELQTAIQRSAVITNQDEIAHCLARIVTTTVTKPYFEYRDFVPKSRTSVVPELEEPAFFDAVLKTISHGTGATSIAFLIDEFEEIGLQARLTRRAAYEYLTTLKRLIELSQERTSIGDGATDPFQFWVVLSMTPPAYVKTFELGPSLEHRIAETIAIDSLDRHAARQLVLDRLTKARKIDDTTLFPFPDDFLQLVGPATYAIPRRLVKVCFVAISEAAVNNPPIPFDRDYVQAIERRLYGDASNAT